MATADENERIIDILIQELDTLKLTINTLTAAIEKFHGEVIENVSCVNEEIYNDMYDDGQDELYDDVQNELYNDGYNRVHNDWYDEIHNNGYEQVYDDGQEQVHDGGYVDGYNGSYINGTSDDMSF